MKNKLPRAFQLLQTGHREQAEVYSRSVLDQEPNNPDAMNLMGLIERDRGSMKLARSWFQKGLEIAPGHLHLLNSIGLVEQALGEFAESRIHFTQALQIDPGYFYARFNLANMYQAQRDFTQAKSLYLEVIGLQPNFVDALANLSFILESEHQLDEAKAFAGEVKALADFLDVEWEDAFFDYQQTAKSRDISTPSASQVIQPLYSSSIGKWKHFREWIRASFEPLDPWVEEWGYQTD